LKVGGTDYYFYVTHATFPNYLTVMGGIHVGGAADPGTDNLVVDGTTTLTGGLASPANIATLKAGAPNTGTPGRLDLNAMDNDAMFRFWTDSATAQYNSNEGGAWSSAAFDFAEKIRYIEEVEPGDLISFKKIENVRKNRDNFSDKGDEVYAGKTLISYDQNIIGIVSTQAGFIGGVPWEEEPMDSPDLSKPLSLVGRVPVKVCTENGDIKVGDVITSSSMPGVGMKATRPGWIVAKAIENYSQSDPKKISKIIAFVTLGWKS